MKISKDEYKKLKGGVERELRNYPYYLITLETPGLGDATNWNEIRTKSTHPGSKTEKSVIDNEHAKFIVNAIEYVYDRLDDVSKRIMDLFYFRDDWTIDEILKELHIEKNKFYKLKSKALYKFIIVLGYL